jgi:protocatechuate 3,4-dioxygenase beta subunit
MLSRFPPGLSRRNYLQAANFLRLFFNSGLNLTSFSYCSTYNDSMTVEKQRPITRGNDEGPYYSPGSPQNSHLCASGIPGENFVLRGSVTDQLGKPLAGAWLDFWQADGTGHYDNKGFTLRGHQFADNNGRYELDTVIPGSYPGRTPHIHVKARASEKSPLFTTQLFLSGISSQNDFLYHESLVIKIEETPQGKTGSFDFVLET